MFISTVGIILSIYLGSLKSLYSSILSGLLSSIIWGTEMEKLTTMQGMVFCLIIVALDTIAQDI